MLSRDQRRQLDLLAKWNAQHLESRIDDRLDARIQSYELAFRMQMEVPNTLSIEDESQATLDAYGIGVEPTDNFARRCLLSRKLIEKGVRFVQLYASTWDSHDYIEKAQQA